LVVIRPHRVGLGGTPLCTCVKEEG
jgi:hypothetical protein